MLEEEARERDPAVALAHGMPRSKLRSLLLPAEAAAPERRPRPSPCRPRNAAEPPVLPLLRTSRQCRRVLL